MPFTPSHAVVALPFVRTPLVPSAIAVGAMTPDLPLFVRGVGPGYSFTHSFGNVLWTAVIAFVLFLLWRVMLRPAVSEFVPDAIARRLPAAWERGGWSAAREAAGAGQTGSYPVLLAVSLVLGVLSHIVWDLFTHEGRWGVQVLPWLAAQWGPLPGFRWLQHGSSVVGLVVIALWALLWLRRRPVRPSVRHTLPRWARAAWWLSLPAVLAAASAIGLALYGPLSAEFTVQHLAYRMLPPACAIWGAGSLLLCCMLPAMQAHQRG